MSIEYDQVVKEQEEARKRAEEAKNKLTKMAFAATTIQSFWRSKKNNKKEKKGKKERKEKVERKKDNNLKYNR